MIITDPKKLSMPQQVQKNKEDIEDIRKIIDGLDVEDNVVVVNDISQILTAEELEAIKQPVAFIVYNNHLYLKGKTIDTTAYFDIVFSITASTVITFESSEIQVELSNGALNLVNSTVSTYSETQIDNKLSLKANITYVDNNFASLSGANFTGAITAPSIIENMSGYSIKNVNAIVDEMIYASVCKNGNKITFVIFGTITPVAQTNYNIVQFTIPEAVGEKLYPFTSGAVVNLLEVKNASCFTDSTSITDAIMRVRKESNTTITFELRAQSLTANTQYHLRFECTFLLSENLAQ